MEARGNTSRERENERRRREKTECDIGPWRRPLKDTPDPVSMPVPFYGQDAQTVATIYEQ